jgi:hypothetical protein
MRRIRKHWWIGLSGLAVAATIAIVALCESYQIWSLDGWRVYQAMATDCHPAWQDFHFGRVRAGDPVEVVIAQTQPTRVERKDRWVVLYYQKDNDGKGLCWTVMTAVAHDGEMVCAVAQSCTWTRLFFDNLTDEQIQDFGGRPRGDPHRWGIGVVVR